MQLFKTIFGSNSKPSVSGSVRFRVHDVSILGNSYKVKVKVDKRNTVKINQQTLEVTIKSPAKAVFDTYFRGWYRRAARKEFQRAIDLWLPEFERLEYDIPNPRLKIFKMSRAWGRCYYTKELITLNINLLGMPRECVEYIALHELTHFVAHDHGRLFWAIIDKIDPEWEAKRQRLRELEPSVVPMR